MIFFLLILVNYIENENFKDFTMKFCKRWISFYEKSSLNEFNCMCKLDL